MTPGWAQGPPEQLAGQRGVGASTEGRLQGLQEGWATVRGWPVCGNKQPRQVWREGQERFLGLSRCSILPQRGC